MDTDAEFIKEKAGGRADLHTIQQVDAGTASRLGNGQFAVNDGFINFIVDPVGKAFDSPGEPFGFEDFGVIQQADFLFEFDLWWFSEFQQIDPTLGLIIWIYEF